MAFLTTVFEHRRIIIHSRGGAVVLRRVFPKHRQNAKRRESIEYDNYYELVWLCVRVCGYERIIILLRTLRHRRLLVDSCR